MSKKDARPPAVILAGGLSRRMGRDKAQVALQGKPLALRIVERLKPQVSTVYLNASRDHPLATHLSLIPDTRPDRPGPLAGVLAGLRHLAERPEAATHLLTSPCDTPFLPTDLAERLVGNAEIETIVLARSGGRTHPITALWPLSLADDLEAWLSDPAHRRVFDFVARHQTKTVDFAPFHGPFGPVDPFFNVNTPEDLETARAILEHGAA